MTSRLLNFSIALNLLLLGVAGYLSGKSTSGDNIPAADTVEQTDRPATTNPGLAPVAVADPLAPAPLRWSQLESEDYTVYVANLRKAGCPEPVLRRIIGAELNELYAQKAFALVSEFHRDFWEIAARENIREYFDRKPGREVKTLRKEADALLNLLVGDGSSEPSVSPAAMAPDSRLADFLSEAKQEQLRRLTERYEARQLQAIRQTDLSPEDQASHLAQLRLEMETEQAEILSPAEWAELQLRQSSAARELEQLHGVDFSETELRSIAQAMDDYSRRTETQSETDLETLDHKLQIALGPSRFADFDRARSASFRELYELASEFGQPGSTAAEIYDWRLNWEKQSDLIRSDKTRTADERQALLDELYEQAERTVLSKFGAEAFQSYKAGNGRWIDALGRR